MAKKTPSTPTVGDPSPEAGAPDKRSPMERESEAQEQKLIEMIRAEKLNGGVIVLKRRTITDTKFSYLAELAADNFSQQQICNIYGGGDYTAQVLKADRTFVTTFAFSIDHKIPAKYPGVEEKPREEKREDRTPEVIAAMTTALKNALPAPPPPQDNSLVLALLSQQAAQAAQQADLLKALLVQRAAAPDPALAELRAEIRSLKEAAGNKAPGASLSSQIKDYIALQEIIGGGSGGGDDGEEKPDRLTQIVTALAPALAPLVAKLVNPGAPAPVVVQPIQTALPAAAAEPVLPAAARPAATAEPKPAPAAVDDNTDPMLNPLVSLYIGRFRSLALKAAAKGQSAADWVTFMLDSLPDDAEKKLLRQIFTLANGEDWFQKIFAADATATRHMQWLLDMRNAVLTHAFVFQVTANYQATPPMAPEDVAKAFIGTVSPSYLDTLYDLTDPEAWTDAFKDAGIDAVWLEKLRLVFEKELGDEEEPAAAPDSVGAETGAAAGEKKVEPTAPPKNARKKSQ